MAEEDYDLIIIGAGIIGACAAYLAARDNPGRSVLLLERGMVGGGATQYSVGLALPYGYTPLRRALALQSHAMFEDLRREISAISLRELPLFGIVSEGRVDEILGNFVLPGARLATDDEIAGVREMYPGLRLDAGRRVIAGGSCHHADPRGVARLLVAAARGRLGVDCWEGTAVASVVAGEGEWTVTTSDGRALRAPSVLDATGPWLPTGPAGSVASDHGVRVKKVAAMHIDSPPAPGAPVLFFFDEDAFLLPVPDEGRWLFSFTLRVWDVLPGELAMTSEDRAAALEVLDRFMPSLVEHCASARVFCDAYAPDWTPVIDRAGAPGFVAAGVGCGSGYRLAPAIAMRALDLLDADRLASHASTEATVHQ